MNKEEEEEDAYLYLYRYHQLEICKLDNFKFKYSHFSTYLNIFSSVVMKYFIPEMREQLMLMLGVERQILTLDTLLHNIPHGLINQESYNIAALTQHSPCHK